MPQSEPPSFHVRLTHALMKRIKLAAVENQRSINAEIAARLENSFDLDDGERQQLRAILTDARKVLDKGGLK
ncbi:Arc family DNA-binding protein [Mesorhizobium sp. B1-1-4]|uniref:Arc family DNA-binding protein n=1 Tax=Mesorhizobium sp. B1-1-4 TaxID=2589980 RepID=UPI001127EC61|nr:Arc family DNA-binding protein [Mesorhizobium sp. B1-1-4]TPN44423.1 Arc family DNA-binding protein [Mesorhizobium sp. B1-1-4]